MTKKVHIDIVAKDKTKQAIASSKRGLGGLKTFALAASAALATVGAGKLISNLVTVGKEVESLQVRFKFLFGSAEEGKVAFDNLATFAGKVPFSLEEIARSSGNLAVVSKDAKDLSRILEITGNVAAVTGLDFQTTASQIQRAFSGGIAAADVFREKGVRSLLGFKQGAKVSLEETVQAFEDTFSGDGKFGSATDELAKTFEGTVSMIGDKFFKLKQAINESFFTEVTNQFGDLNTVLEENEESFLAFGRAIGSLMATTFKEFVDTISLIVSAFQLLGRTLDKVIESTGIFGSLIEKILTPFGLLGDAVGYVFDNNEKWAESLDKINPKIETNAGLIDDAQRKHSGYATTLKEEVIPAVQELDQDLLDLQDALEPLGNAFDTAFKPLDDAIVKSEEARKKKLEESFQNFKDVKFKEIDFQKMTEKEAQQMTREGFRTALQEGAKHNKALFRLNQAMNIANAVMNTATGVTEALKLGPIIGPPLAIAIGAMGAVQVATIASQQPPAQFGGSRLPNSPFLVGERGPELFTPNTAGTVTPNHQLGGGGATVNFNITTVDAQSFGNLLDTRRGQIVNMINSALNNKGQAALV